MDQLRGIRLYHLDRSLPERRVLKLSAAGGARIVALAGDVWITEDGRYADVVLAAGESAVLKRDGMALITTFDSADVEVVLPAPAEAKPLPAVDAELVERSIRSARRLRAQAMGAAFADAVDWVRGKLWPAAAPQRACCAG